MSVIGSTILAGASGAGGAAAAGYQIDRSLRFNDDDSAYLSKVFASAGDRQKWTWSGWAKRSTADNTTNLLFYAEPTVSSYAQIGWSGDNFQLNIAYSGTSFAYIRAAAESRDVSAWAHYVVVYDSANATSTDRMILYINGARVTDFATSSFPNQNALSPLNLNTTHYIGTRKNVNQYFDGYLAEVHFIDGQALAPTDFGEYDDNNVWQPKAYSGSYGTNGFHLDFSDNTSTTTIAEDSSGNNNDWTANNIVVSSPVYAFSTTAASSGTVTNGTSNPYWIDFDPVDADLDYDSTAGGMTRVHDGNTSSTEVYWTGNLGSSGNVKRARFDLRDFPTITSLRVYGGFQTGYVNYQYRLLDSSKTEISGTSGTFGTVGWHSLTISGSPRYLEMSCLHSSSSSTRHRLYGIEVNGTVLVNGNPGDIDSLIDTPTDYEPSSGNNAGNYCTLNPLVGVGTGNLTDGNLSQVTTSGWSRLFPTIMPNTGKWYVECFQTNYAYGSRVTNVGVAPVDNINITSASKPGSATDEVAYETQYKRTLVSGAAGQTGFPTYVSNDIIGVAIDFDNRNVQFYLNNSAMGTATTFPSTTKDYTFIIGCTGSTAEAIVNFGARSFNYTPPTGFKTLCTQNLDDPTIADGSTAMDVALYTGATGTKTISGLNFEPDMVWVKSRSISSNHNLFDQVRGISGGRLIPNLTNAETGGGISSYTSDGWEYDTNLQNFNQNGVTYVGWAWDAGANSSKTFTVKVVSDSGNKYRFDDFGTSAVTLDLEEGSTYVFDQSDSSNSGHPLRFSTTSDGTHGSGSEYTTGVTTTGTPGSAGAKTTIVVAASAPTLYYYCSVHSGMGGQANTNSTAGASNFDGTHQSTVRANAETGFSISTHSRTTAGSISTWGHGLGAAPEFAILKPYNGSYNWIVWHKSTGYRKRIFLNSSSAGNSYSFDVWSSDSTTLGVYGTIIAGGGTALDCLTLAWAPIEGFSKFGSYEGTGSSSAGPFIFTGFKPAWVMVKNIDGTGAWVIYDNARGSYNFNNAKLAANLSGEENNSTLGGTSLGMDFLSNGFKYTGDAGGNHNSSGQTYIWAAWAEHPFKTARAR